MKIRRKEFEKGGKGSVTLIAEESEDLWHLYNLVAAGDDVKALTFRKVKRDDGKGTETKKLRLTITVKNVEYDAEGEAIRFAGQVCEANDWVSMGDHHTIEIELNEPITITKDCWDEIYLQQLEDATDIAKSAEVAVVLIEAADAGTANFSLLTNVLAKRVGQVQHSLPKKKLTSTNLDKAMEKFFVKVYDLLKEKVNLEIIKCVVFGGPGSAKNDFNSWCQTRAMQQGDSTIVKQKGMFVCVDTTSIHNEGLNQILSDPQVQRRVANTRAALHFKALEELQRRLANSPELAVYGQREVRKAFDMAAIDTMMISDELFRSASIKERKEYVEFVAQVKDSGSTVHVFSSGHVTGQKLKELTGIAATLRFQVEFDELDEAEAEAAAQQAASSAPVPQETAEPVEKNSTSSSAPTPKQTGSAQKPAVAELLLALGDKVSQARVENALSAAHGIAHDAFLVLLAEELDGTGKEPPKEEKKEQISLAAGDVVEVSKEFKTNSKNAIELSKGQVGKVAKIDDAGDAYIDFGEGIGKHWVKPRSWCNLSHSKASFAPPPRSTAAKSKAEPKAAQSAAPKSKSQPKAQAKTKAKAKPKKATMQWDDYDYYD